MEDGIPKVWLSGLVFKELAALGPAAHAVQEDAGCERFPTATGPFDLIKCFGFRWRKVYLAAQPGFGFRDVPKAPFAGGVNVFVEKNWQG